MDYTYDIENKMFNKKGDRIVQAKNHLYVLTIVLFSLVIFISCSDDDNPTANETRDDRLVGNWTLTKIIIPAFAMELTPEEAGFMVTGTVKDDGTFSMTTTDSTGTIVELGEWSTNGSTLTMAYEDGRSDELQYSVSDNVIKVTSPIEMQGMELMADLEFLKQ